MLNFLNEPNKKFDLHIHTTYSDGRNSVKQIIALANQKKLDYIAITDHDNVEAQFDLIKNNYYNFNGKIITGCELSVEVDGFNMEFLAYNFDLKKFAKYKYVKRKYNQKINLILAKKLLKNVKNYGFKISKNFKFTKLKEKLYNQIFDDIVKHSENIRLLEELKVRNYKDFLRCHIKSPYSKLYVSPIGYCPNGKDVVKFIHKCGGTAILAHGFFYGEIDGKLIIEKALKCKVDGLECVHMAHTKEQIKYIYEVAKKHNLIITAGSDFHGGYRHVGAKLYKSIMSYANLSKFNLNTNIFKDLENI